MILVPFSVNIWIYQFVRRNIGGIKYSFTAIYGFKKFLVTLFIIAAERLAILVQRTGTLLFIIEGIVLFFSID